MDSKEAYSYFETAQDQLKDAELVLKEGRFTLCAFLSALCAENATSALLIKWAPNPAGNTETRWS